MPKGKLPMHDLPASNLAVQFTTRNHDYLIQVDSLGRRLWFSSTNHQFPADFGPSSVVLVDNHLTNDMFFLMHQMVQSLKARVPVPNPNVIGYGDDLRWKHTMDTLTAFAYDKLSGTTIVFVDPESVDPKLQTTWCPTRVRDVKVHWFERPTER
jgi:hypothetical protein